MFFDFDEILNDFFSLLIKHSSMYGINLYIVGGAVRDRLLGVKIKDFDIIIGGNAIDFSKNLPSCIKVLSVHKEFFTVKVEYKGRQFDIASTRTESYPYSGCLPVVNKVGVSIYEDAKRRDFTVNSMYCRIYSDNGKLNFKFVDIFNSVNDIKNKKLKVLHDKSYIDDPTRIFRGLGLKYRFGFDFDSYNLKLINEYLKNIDYSNYSFSRCLAVFKDTLKINPVLIFKEITEKKYYKILQKDNIKFNFDKILNCIDLFNLNNKEQIEFLTSVILNNPITIGNFDTYLSIYKFFGKFKNNAEIAYYFYMTEDDVAIKYLDLKNISLILKGNDLAELGYKQGKIFSEIFNKLFEAKLKNPVLFNSKNDELNFVKSNFPLI